MRRRRLLAYIDRLVDLKPRKRPLKRDAAHQAIGAGKKDAGRDARFVKVSVEHHGEGKKQAATLSWRLDRAALRTAWKREARYIQPEKDLQLLLDQMKLTLTEPGSPKITAPKAG